MQPKQSFDSCNHGVPRIPQALQAVFLDGNRGIEVNTPPSDKSAMKTFRRRTWSLGSSRSKISGVSNKSETKSVKANVSVEPKRPKKKKVSDHLLSDCIVGKRSKRFLTAMVVAIHFSHHNCLLCLSCQLGHVTSWSPLFHSVIRPSFLIKNERAKIQRNLI
jgi:hypothetical protein